MDSYAPLSVDGASRTHAPLLLSALLRAHAEEADPRGLAFDQAPPMVRENFLFPAAIPGAVDAAFALAARPTFARAMRAAPLPTGVLIVIRIAAGCSDTLKSIVMATGRNPAFIRAAATVYIERILWSSDGDHYRALGVSRDARPRELAQHFLWFAKWVSTEWGWRELEEAFAKKVLTAWNALKSAELRRQYDQSRLMRARESRVASVKIVPLEERLPRLKTTLRAHPPPTLKARRAASWQLAAVGVAFVAVVAIATLNWIALDLPASASASSSDNAISNERGIANLSPAGAAADGSRGVKTYLVRAKDDDRLVPTTH